MISVQSRTFVDGIPDISQKKKNTYAKQKGVVVLRKICHKSVRNVIGTNQKMSKNRLLCKNKELFDCIREERVN